jgi:hypothetical protein
LDLSKAANKALDALRLKAGISDEGKKKTEKNK